MASTHADPREMINGRNNKANIGIMPFIEWLKYQELKERVRK